jgi:hypothetical protein
MDEPFFLPDGKHFLYAVTPWSSPREIRVGELGKPEQDGVAVVPGQMPQFASGRLLFSRDTSWRNSFSKAWRQLLAASRAIKTSIFSQFVIQLLLRNARIV